MADIEHHDIVIIGAGLTGINTAHAVRTQMPNRQFTILEGRSVVAGTWNFFKYPGFRSDSSLSSFGYKWHPWKKEHLIATGPEIVSYIEEASKADGSWNKIRFRHQVQGCSWSTEEGKWTLNVDADGKPKTLKANFVLSCTGYYSYSKVLEAKIPGIDSFKGDVIHPQFWPEGFDYSNKRIVVIGSGATTITLIPSLAAKAESVVQLQRSPSYVISRPNSSFIRNFLTRILPWTWAHTVCWWLATSIESCMTQVFVRAPRFARAFIGFDMRRSMPTKIDTSVHFNPLYNPFEQRLCLCPDGDYFDALAQDNVEVVTDVVDTVESDGIVLKSGRKLEADVIVTATGLYFELFNGIKPVVDGKEIDVGQRYVWRGCMLEGLPNMAFIIGYVTQSWTPGAMIMGDTAIRIMQIMEKKGASVATPYLKRWKGMPAKLAVDATSNYFLKAADRIPKATGQGPWYGRTSLIQDAWAFFVSKLDDGLVFTGVAEAKKTK